MSAVLVAYATRSGSTREVAERVAGRLADQGLQTDVRAAGEVRSLDGYDAVVFGGALYMFRLVGEGRRFFSKHRKQLAQMPVAVFAMGPVEKVKAQFADARGHLDKTLTKYSDLSPVAVTIFGGVLDPTKLKFPYANPGVKAMPAADLRDWPVIEAWADSLPPLLGVDGD